MTTCQWGHPDCILNTQQILYLAEKTAPWDWKKLLLNQNIDDHILQQVEHDFESEGCVGVAYQGLLKWKQQFPENVSLCNIPEALSAIGRNDLKNVFEEQFAAKSVNRSENELSLNLSKNFIGREKEMMQVREFCRSSSKKKLLIVCGLPGIGKSELINQAMSLVREENPDLDYFSLQFPAVFGDTIFNLDNLAAMVYEEMKPGTCLAEYGVPSLYRLLLKVSKPTVLFLQMTHADFCQREIRNFWNLIFNVLRPESELRIIVTCNNKPDVSQVCFDLEVLRLQALNSESVIDLLQRINPKLSKDECESIAAYCYGNPFLICKMGALVKNFVNSERELKNLIADLANISQQDNIQMLMNRTVLKWDLQVLFENLHKNEQDTLVQLSCFYDTIPIDIVNSVFGPHVKCRTHVLYATRGLLEKRNSEMYHMSELLRAFIEDYCHSHDYFRELLLNSEIKLIKFYSKFLWDLDEVYFAPSTLHKNLQVRIMVTDYRKSCKKCKTGRCDCSLPMILQLILLKLKGSLLRHIEIGLSIETTFANIADSCTKAMYFLRKLPWYYELQGLFKNIFTKSLQRKDKLRTVVNMASLVLIKSVRDVLEEKDAIIGVLTFAIECLQQEPNLDKLFVDVLANCCLKRGYLRQYCYHQFAEALSDVDKARNILSKKTLASKLMIPDQEVNSILAHIHYFNGTYDKSIQERKIQLEHYKKNLDLHPYTAKCLGYLGEAYTRAGLFETAQEIFKEAYHMHEKLKGPGVETMTVLAMLGENFVRAGQVEEGIRYFEMALTDGENILGEHYRLVWCYEQLGKAKQKLFGDTKQVEDLRKKVQHVRKQYDEKRRENAMINDLRMAELLEQVKGDFRNTSDERGKERSIALKTLLFVSLALNLLLTLGYSKKIYSVFCKGFSFMFGKT